MSCPRCNGPLEEIYARVHMPMPFTDPEIKARRKRWTRKRMVYKCTSCDKAFIRTLALMETEIVDK